MKYREFPDIEGQKFSKVLVKEVLPNRMCIIECDCGTTKTVRKYDVYHNKIRSCGRTECSSKLKDIQGLKINCLTILELVPNEQGLKTRSSIWKCQCDCGKIFLVPSNMIHTNRTKSCGCEKGRMIAEKIGHPLEYGIWNSLFLSYKHGAKSRNIDFHLSKDEFLSFLKKNCYYCGIEPSKILRRNRSHGKIEILYNGIDRKDNTIGYTMNNCVTCCKTCNIAKNDMSYEQFSSWAKRLSSNLTVLERTTSQVFDDEDEVFSWSGNDF